MSNFLEFINEDIESKKTLLSAMPVNNKANRKELNNKIAAISEKYNSYKEAVYKYINIKSTSFNINESKDTEELQSVINNLEHIRSILNPYNTYFEKMGFDNLFYMISNYQNLKFEALNAIINEFLNKFEAAHVSFSSTDFEYTYYVNEYMGSFLDARRTGSYEKVSEIFEKLYWTNPDIISHIELNFRKLIRKNEKHFIEYIEKLKKDILLDRKVTDYEDLLEKLKEAYIKLNISEEENISDIINLAKSGKLDISQYFEDSKTRNSTYLELMIDPIDSYDKEAMDKFHKNIEKLKINLKEYQNFTVFIPLIEDFKTKYAKLLTSDSKEPDKGLKELETRISDKETALEKINKNIFDNKEKKFGFKSNNDVDKLKMDSVKQAKELYELYKEYNEKYFADKVLLVLNGSFTITEWLNLYYSFNYYKKTAISRVFDINNDEQLIKYSDDFDLFAKNLSNVIVNGILLFEENNVVRVIVNKYRLNNININEESLSPDNLEKFISKLQLPLRINTIEKSSTSLEKIWFMTQVEKINNA